MFCKMKPNTLLLKTVTFRQFCNNAPKSLFNERKVIKPRKIGQPTFESHPQLLKPDEVTPKITKFEYQSRRQNLIEIISAHSLQNKKEKHNHLIVIPAASKKYMSDKIPYVFRQNTDFSYLTGNQEPDCCVVITIGETADRNCTILFTRDKDEHAELWDGPRTHSEDAPSFFGVDLSLPISELANYINSYKKTYKNTILWYDFMNPIQNDVHKVVEEYLVESRSKAWETPINFVHNLRLFKSEAEVELMQESCDIAAGGFIETMKLSKPGIGENQLYAAVDYKCRMDGAEFLAYPPVVAGGNRATTIHYINNNQIVNNGELVLMDAGCEVHGYSSDITRTWPVNGQFSPEQRIIYEAVLDVQEELIKYCSELPTLDQLFERMCHLLGKQLQAAGLIGVQPSQQYLLKAAYQLCPHHVSHYLGMDVHDTSSVTRNIKLQPGMIITIEPGIYVNSKNKIVPREFQGIGVRIEDDVLITDNGPVVLSRHCPKQIEEIEELVN